GDQPRIRQHFEVLRAGRLGDREPGRERATGDLLGRRNGLEEAEARRIGQRFTDFDDGLGGHTPPSYRYIVIQLYTIIEMICQGVTGEKVRLGTMKFTSY